MSADPATTAPERLLIVSPVYNEAATSIAPRRPSPRRSAAPTAGSSSTTVRATTRLQIARRWERELDFVTVLSAPQLEGDTGPDRLALAKEARAFNLGLREAGWREFTHIGKLDGDVELPPQWFATLLERFRAEPGSGSPAVA